MILFKPRVGKVIFAQTTDGLCVIIPKVYHVEILKIPIQVKLSSDVILSKKQTYIDRTLSCHLRRVCYLCDMVRGE